MQRSQEFDVILDIEIAKHQAKETLMEGVGRLEVAHDVLENHGLTKEASQLRDLISKAKLLARRLS